MSITVGDILILHDADTGASPKNRVRPCMVVAAGASVVVIAPRSVSVKGPVSTPAAASSGFSAPGSFSRWRLRVSRAVAEAATNHGQLSEPFRSNVLALHTRPRKP